MSLNLNRLLLYLMFGLLMVVGGCEAISDFPENGNNARVPVIEAVITSKNEPQKIKVSYTATLGSDSSSIPIENAIVRVWNNQGDTVNFHHAGTGEYYSPKFAAEEGKSYTLQVKTPFFTAVSVSEAMPVKTIDSIYCRLENVKDSTYHVFLNAGKVDPSTTSYYIVQAYKGSELITKGDELWILEDKYLDNINDLEVFYEFKHGDTLYFELQSLTKPLFNYYSALKSLLVLDQLYSQNYKSNPPKLFTGDADVLGFFQVSMVSRKRIVIK